MSIEAMVACWGAALTATELLVLLAMADHADDDGNGVRPGVELLAAKTGLDPRTVQRIQGRLTNSHHILIEQGRTVHGVVEYSIDLDAIDKTENYLKRRRLHGRREDNLRKMQLAPSKRGGTAPPLPSGGGDTTPPLIAERGDTVPPGGTVPGVALCRGGVALDPKRGGTDDIAYKESSLEPSEPSVNRQSADALENSFSDSDGSGDEERTANVPSYTDDEKIPVFGERTAFLRARSAMTGEVPTLDEQRAHLVEWCLESEIDPGIALQICGGGS